LSRLSLSSSKLQSPPLRLPNDDGEADAARQGSEDGMHIAM
jgi:hypothetical protein